MLSFLFFLLLIFPLVIVHELGHYLVGKILKAEPDKFSFGMGKVLFSFDKWSTNWRFSLLPIGGYVSFKKAQFSFEENKERIDPWRWIFIALAGPLANFIYTLVIFFGLFFYLSGGVQVYKGTDGSKYIKLTERVKDSYFKKMVIGENIEGEIFLIKGDTPYKVGEVPEFTKRVDSLSSRLDFSFSTTIYLFGNITSLTVQGLGSIFTKEEGYKSVSGPIGIAGEAKRAALDGPSAFLFLSGLISFALGFFNLFPLFILDGGRALVAIIETISRKELSVFAVNYYGFLSFIILFLLIGVATYSDIVKVFFN